MTSLRDIIESSAPLSRVVAAQLIDYSEEDDCLDYKQTFNYEDDKAWFSLIKDVSAFANTYGGYLLFGVSDDGDLTGLNRQVEAALKDINLLHQKLNSYVEPEFSGLRSQSFRFEGKTIVVLFIPRSINRNHLIKRDAVLHKQSKTPKTVLYKGTLYIRRSGHNHLADSRDLDDLLERRIDKFREALMGKVAQVIQSPVESNVYMLSRDSQGSGGAERFIIEDSPDSKHMKGLSFTVAPEEAEEEVAAWGVLSRRSPDLTPPFDVVWGWYEDRHDLQLTEKHKLKIFRFCLFSQIPAFFWIQRVENSLIRDELLDALRYRPKNIELKPFLMAAALLGKGTYSSALKLLGEQAKKLPIRLQRFPELGAYTQFCTIKPTKIQKLSELKTSCSKDLNDLIKTVKEKKRGLIARNRWKALDLDFFLYARSDNYKIKK